MATGSSDSKQVEHARVEPATTQPSPQGRRGLDVVAHMATRVIDTDTVTLGTLSTITGSSNLVLEGDLIQFTSGNLVDQFYVVQEIFGTTLTLAQELPEAPAASDAYDVLRYFPLRLSASSTISTTSEIYAVRYDDTEAGGVSYIGESLPGVLPAAAGWRIKRMVETGPDIVITWADGDSNFDNIWDNRAALSYS